MMHDICVRCLTQCFRIELMFAKINCTVVAIKLEQRLVLLHLSNAPVPTNMHDVSGSNQSMIVNIAQPMAQ
jgi:hypothetical protein